MAQYGRGEARDWARENMAGICGCLLPTFNSSLTTINERAIRHDVRLERELGYWGTLLVPEVGTTTAEMQQVIDISVDEAQKVGLRTMLLASAATLGDAIELVRYGENAGVDMVMISYPLMFYPRSEQEVYDYTRAVAESTKLGVMLFCVNQWNFGRLHPSGFSPRLMERLIDDVENIVAIKNEIGGIGVGGQAEVFYRFNDRVVVTDPFEQNAPLWTQTFGMRFMGTSNYEYLGRDLVQCFNLLQEKRWQEAMDIYWRLHPARQANSQLAAEYMPASGLIHRQLWKYQYWLNGFNGGPVRQPHHRLNDRQMRTLRQALVSSGGTLAPGDDADFFIGRNPME